MSGETQKRISGKPLQEAPPKTPPRIETILAVDPSLRSTGYAVLSRQGNKIACREYDTIRNKPSLLASGCLLAIRDRLRQLMQRYEPAIMAVEGVIFVQSYPTAITLGAARGSAILAAAECGIPVHEYAPRRVKQAVVGRGAADKQQVAFMVRVMLGLSETPPSDAADAIAIGITHFQAADAAKLKRVPLDRI